MDQLISWIKSQGVWPAQSRDILVYKDGNMIMGSFDRETKIVTALGENSWMIPFPLADSLWWADTPLDPFTNEHGGTDDNN